MTLDVMNSLHATQHSVRDHQVTFLDPALPNQAHVKSAKTPGKEYVVRNIYSNFPSCSCKWAEQGNTCKHQLKALLVRGHDDGVLVQQLGTRFGSSMDGISHLESNDINNDFPEPTEDFSEQTDILQSPVKLSQQSTNISFHYI